MYLTLADGTILDANPAACRLHGMTLDEIRRAGRAGLVVTDGPHSAALDEERFRLLAITMPQIVCVLGPDGTPEYVNPSWIAFSGLDLEATSRAGWDEIVHPDDFAAVRDCRAGARARPRRPEATARRPEDARAGVSGASPALAGGGFVLLCSLLR